jgi:ribonuclease HI
MLGVLGTSTNNQVEAYTLLQGLKIASSIGIQRLSVIGDSKMSLGTWF